jgi:hypothetical protein
MLIGTLIEWFNWSGIFFPANAEKKWKNNFNEIFKKKICKWIFQLKSWRENVSTQFRFDSAPRWIYPYFIYRNALLPRGRHCFVIDQFISIIFERLCWKLILTNNWRKNHLNVSPRAQNWSKQRNFCSWDKGSIDWKVSSFLSTCGGVSGEKCRQDDSFTHQHVDSMAKLWWNNKLLFR